MTTAALIADARTRLAGAPREALGTLVEPRRVLGIARAPRIVPAGDAWHLGAILLADDAVLSVGEILRARMESVRGYTAESQRRRDALAAAAVRGGFPEGATVHLGWHELDLDAVDRGEASGPLAQLDGAPGIRWSPTGGLAPLARYLDERIALLLDPPPGA